jgi:hypothetical protein
MIDKIIEALAWYKDAEPWHNEHSDTMAEAAQMVADAEVWNHNGDPSVAFKPGRYLVISLEQAPTRNS